MSQALAIGAREYRALFRLPVGWIVIALYLFLSGLVFGMFIIDPGEPASLRAFFAVSGWVLMPIAPAISMRLLSEEFRSGSIEPLMTAPVPDWSVVAGKYAGAAAFLLTMLAPTLVYVLVLRLVADPAPEPGPIITGYLSLLLVGLLYLAVGLLASSLTSNQTLAFVGTLFVLLIAMLLADFVAPMSPPWLIPALRALSVNQRIGDFAKGLVNTSHVVYFVTVTAWLLVLAAAALQSRRWR